MNLHPGCLVSMDHTFTVYQSVRLIEPGLIEDILKTWVTSGVEGTPGIVVASGQRCASVYEAIYVVWPGGIGWSWLDGGALHTVVERSP